VTARYPDIVIDDRADRDRAGGEVLGGPPPARSTRGFWFVAGAMALAGIVVVVAIVANLGVKDTIAHAQHSLRTAQAAAEAIRADAGTFDEADAAGLAASLPDHAIVGAETPSTDLDEVSVSADDATWAAAVQVRPGACFYLRLDAMGTATYGSGTECTGREAERSAVDTDW
jgi:hypothetical protein